MNATTSPGVAPYLKSVGTFLTSDLYALPLFAIPIAALVWSFSKWMSYNQDHADRNTRIQDALDKKTYKEVIIPLYKTLTKNLAETVSSEMTDVATENIDNFLTEYESRKAVQLMQTDYTALEEVIKFQDTVEVFIREKKSKFVLKKCSKQNKKLMMAASIFSLIQIADSIMTVIFKDTAYFSWAIGVWVVLLITLLVITGKYGLNENTIDNLGNA